MGEAGGGCSVSYRTRTTPAEQNRPPMSAAPGEEGLLSRQVASGGETEESLGFLGEPGHGTPKRGSLGADEGMQVEARGTPRQGLVPVTHLRMWPTQRGRKDPALYPPPSIPGAPLMGQGSHLLGKATLCPAHRWRGSPVLLATGTEACTGREHVLSRLATEDEDVPRVLALPESRASPDPLAPSRQGWAAGQLPSESISGPLRCSHKS